MAKNSKKAIKQEAKLEQWFKKSKREENIIKGKELLEKESKRQGYNFSRNELRRNNWKVLFEKDYNIKNYGWYICSGR